MTNLLWGVITILVIMWVFGQVMSFGGPLIHLVLVVVAVLVVFNLLTKGKATL